MKPEMHELNLPGGMLARGFWLYVWEVTTDKGKKWLYVGRTGDSSSVNAQSPFVRLSQHLGANPKSNALRRNLAKAGIEADKCREFRHAAYGPILPEESTMAAHRSSRDTVAGLEKALRDALFDAGYQVLNVVHSRKPVDERLLGLVIKAFAKTFPYLATTKRRTN